MGIPVINRHPAIEEYLGKEYPLYFDSLDEVPNIIENYNLIKRAYKYLKNNSEIHERISGKYFLTNFIKCEVITGIRV